MSSATRICSSCKQPVNITTGLNKDNFNRLFSWPSVQDWILLAVLLLVFFLAYSYNEETKQCRDMLSGLKSEEISAIFPNDNTLNVPDLVVDMGDHYNDTKKEEGVPSQTPE